MNKKLIQIAAGALISLLAISCNSRSTSDNGDSDFDSIFVIDDNNSGTFEIDLSTNEIPVAGTASFSVRVKDANGTPVNNVRVSCDTENDLRIIEPSSGNFFTGSYGSASGVIGCEDTGSFLFACALSNGQSRRRSILVKCEGPRPIGFEGFPGSYGGGLGNGVSDVDDDDDNEFTVRLTDITFNDAGQDSTGIDIFQDSDCDNDGNLPPDGTQDPEIFTDTLVEFVIDNNTEQIVRFTSYRYTVNNFNGSGGVYTSPTLNLIGESLGAGQAGEFSGLFADVGSAGKYFFGLSSPITSDGFRNIDFTLFGTLSDGRSVTVTASQSVSIDDFDNC